MSEVQPVRLAAVASTSIFKADIFKGKVAIVSGGGSGICNGITRQLMRHGANTTIIGRKVERLTKAAKDLEADVPGAKCIASPGDVRNFEDMQRAVKVTVEAYGRVDFVVCGAAGNFMSGLNELSPKGFRTVIEIDLLGTYHLFKASIAEVRKARGSYVHIGANLNGVPWQSAPSAAKSGVDALSLAISTEEGPLGVRSNVVVPGAIAGTEGVARLVPKGSEELVHGGVPLQRMGEIDDISNLCVFLFSDAASYVTGQRVSADGGLAPIQSPFLPYPLSSLEPKELASIVAGSRL